MWWLAPAVSSFAVTALVTSALNWVALHPFRRAVGEHWSVRARLLWPVRRGAALAGLAVPLAIWRVQAEFVPSTLSSVAASWLAGFAGGLLGGFVVHHAAFPRHRFHEWLLLMLCLIVLRYGPFAAWLIAGVTSLFHLPSAHTWLAVAVAAQMLVSSGLWLWMLRGLGMLHAASPELEGMVRELAASLGVSVKHVWETAPVAANAFASPLWSAVVVSRETVRVLTTDELRSIVAHELGHLGEPRRVTLLRLVGSCWAMPLGALGWAVHAWSFTGAALVLMALGVWLRLALRMARAEEHRVDAVARKAVGSGEVAARALEKLHIAGLIPATLPSAKMTHPSLYDRMLASGVTPDFERPPLPQRFAVNGWVAFAVWFGFLVMALRGV